MAVLIGVWLEKKHGVKSVEFKRYECMLPILARLINKQIDIDAALEELQSADLPEVVELFDEPAFMRELFKLAA